MYPQRTLVPSIRSLNSQEEEGNEYSNLQRKLQGYRDTLKIISKANEEDRRNLLQSCRSSNPSCYNTDILQLTESLPDEDSQSLVRENQVLLQQVHEQQMLIEQLQHELMCNKKSMIHTAELMEEVSQQRDQLFNQLQQLKNQDYINHTLLDMTYDDNTNNTVDQSMAGRRRIQSIKQSGKSFEQYNKSFECKTLEELTDLLQTENILKEVKTMKSQLKKQSKFIVCLQDMIIKLTPKEVFEASKPTLRDCWEWIKRFLTDYMNLRKSYNKS